MATDSKPWAERAVRKACLIALAWAMHGLVAAAETPETLALTVQPGDTLIGISERYLVQPARWAELARLNSVAQPRRLQPGSQLLIPLAWIRWDQLPVEVVHVQGTVQGNRGPLATGMQLAQGDSTCNRWWVPMWV